MFVWNGINVDPYEVLEVSHDVTKTELNKKYKTLVKQYRTDGQAPSARREAGFRLINLSRDDILKEIGLREKLAQEKALKEDDYSTLDLEGLKNAIITKFANYITECEVAKVTCEINDVKTLKTVEGFFDQGIAVANNCIELTKNAKSRDEVLSIKGIFDTKKAKFDENFFASLEQVLTKTIVFIRETIEVQTVIRLIKSRDKGVSAQEWFSENQDAFITVIRFEEELMKQLDDILDEYKKDEYYSYMSDEIDETSYKIVVQINGRLAGVRVSYKMFEEAGFLEAFQTEIQAVVDKYHADVEKRKNKIKYLKFSRNISDETVKELEKFIHDGDSFDVIVDTIEMDGFSNLVNAQLKMQN